MAVVKCIWLITINLAKLYKLIVFVYSKNELEGGLLTAFWGNEKHFSSFRHIVTSMFIEPLTAWQNEIID